MPKGVENERLLHHPNSPALVEYDRTPHARQEHEISSNFATGHPRSRVRSGAITVLLWCHWVSSTSSFCPSSILTGRRRHQRHVCCGRTFNLEVAPSGGLIGPGTRVGWIGRHLGVAVVGVVARGDVVRTRTKGVGSRVVHRVRRGS